MLAAPHHHSTRTILLNLVSKSKVLCIQETVYPQLLHFGRFFLPTYGFLVSMGVLIGLWVSVRNSERLGINGDKAWSLGILVGLCGIVGAKERYVINEGMSLRDTFSI